MTDNQSRKSKKHNIDSVISIALNFIIYIWISKIVLHINIFIQDPFAILAYPSDRYAFYLALFLTSITMIYNVYKKKMNFDAAWKTFLPTLLAMFFMYEILQLVVENRTYYFMYIIFYMILLLLYILIENKWMKEMIIVYTWFIMMLISWFMLDTIRIIKYLVHPIFIVGLLIMYTIMIIKKYYTNKRGIL